MKRGDGKGGNCILVGLEISGKIGQLDCLQRQCSNALRKHQTACCTYGEFSEMLK
jgi:hypothetical protein